uniref:NAD(P)-binding domain-containing protein n=1 Tax=Sinocyclocheilus grahami TaxID=75366 RepID=A0A672Q7G9_SINGR
MHGFTVALPPTPAGSILESRRLIMKIAVVGATGQTGQQLLNQALQQGHSVTALVRNPGKLTVTHENLKVVEADIFSEDSLKLHFKGQDAVLSCLGFPISFFYGVTGYTQSMKAALNAMREVKVNRIITMTSWYTDPNSGSNSSFLIRFMLLPMIRSVLNNMYEMESFLKQTDDINWTVVRPPGLKNTPTTDMEKSCGRMVHFWTLWALDVALAFTRSMPSWMTL